MKKSFFLLTVLLIFPFTNYSQENDDEKLEKAVNKGKEIGTLVKSIVETALPVWGSISSVLWPDGKNKKVKKEDADAAMVKFQDSLQEQLTARLAKTAKEEIKPIEDLASELSVVYRIAEASMLGQQELPQLTAELNREEVNWADARDELEDVKADLNKMDDVTVDEIRQKVKERTLRLTLENIKSNKEETLRRLTRYLRDDTKDKERAVQQIQKLMEDLQPVNYLTSGYIFDIYSDLKGLSFWSKEAMNGNEEVENVMFSELEKILPKQ